MMSWEVVSLWAANLVVDTAGQLAFKAAAMEAEDATATEHWRHMLVRPWLWAGVACFAVEFFLWLAFLAVVPLAEGVLLGMMGIVTVMLGGRVLFGERFTRPRLIGVSLIVLGVALVGAGGN